MTATSAARPLPALGWDPCPGDPPGVRALADELRRLAGRLRSAQADARADAPAWTGPAATAHRERVAALPGALGVLARSVDALADVLGAWADELVALQRRADDVERRMVVARDELRDASGVLALAARGTSGVDLLVGRPPGWSAHVDHRRAVEAAATGRAEVEAAARRLHEEYLDAAERAHGAVARTVDDGLRAGWSGREVTDLGGADASWAERPRPVPTVLRRTLVEDGYAEGVRRHTDDLAAYAGGSGDAAAVLGWVSLPHAQVVARGADVSGSLATASLELVVAEDPVAALGAVGAAGASLVAGPAVRRAVGQPGRALPLLEPSSTSLLAGAPQPPPSPKAWEVPGRVGTARRDGREVDELEERRRRAAADRERAADVLRCTGG
ncbi:hypothetical protein [uncultured Pseudokineococcus sp.]|uniref:hypothetical protein n=1 Tax=uncultured Pseudokineococcus sp. TaxID=1642928 RepID=UPI002637D27A|nr:hypothetical protein [uncultured Pseudokineococcus sp.]